VTRGDRLRFNRTGWETFRTPGMSSNQPPDRVVAQAPYLRFVDDFSVLAFVWRMVSLPGGVRSLSAKVRLSSRSRTPICCSSATWRSWLAVSSRKLSTAGDKHGSLVAQPEKPA
jgi:hypothetical protein